MQAPKTLQAQVRVVRGFLFHLFAQAAQETMETGSSLTAQIVALQQSAP